MKATIDAVADFEIYPAFVDIVVEFVLVNDLLWDVGELNFDILRIVEWCCYVVVADVVGDELGSFAWLLDGT